jgi:hypothetical protein
MKKIIVFFLFNAVVGCLSISLAQEVVTSDGGFFDSSNGSISFTTGEVVSETMADESVHLTQGMQQVNIVVTSILESEMNKVNITPYPNPVQQFLHISSDSWTNAVINFELFSIKGELLNKGVLMESNPKIDIGNFKSGTYILKLKTKDNTWFGEYKIIKE